MLLTETEARRLCDQLLRKVKADDALVRVTSDNFSHLRFAANTFTTSGHSEDTAVEVTVWIGKRRGESAANEIADAALAQVVQQAEQIARVAPVDREYVPTLGPQTYRPVTGYVEATSEISLTDRARTINEVMLSCEKAGLIGAGYHEARGSATATATKNGNFGYHRRSLIDFTLTARTRDGKGSGFFSRDHFDVARLDIARVAREAMQKAAHSHDPQAMDAGEYPVILEPQAVGDLLSFQRFAFDARRADEGRSPFSAPGGKTRLGETMFDERINFYSDPWNPELPGSQATSDGIPAEKIYLIRNGVVENLIYSRYWAQQKGKAPTPGPVNTILESAAEPSTLEEMIQSAGRALLVSRFWYIRMVNPQTLSFTGLTRDGVWLIENGKISRPARNFRFNQSVLQMLASGNVERISAPERVNESLMPALMLKSFRFTSQSEAV